MRSIRANRIGSDRPAIKLGRLPAFDMLRAGAATLVFLFHYSGFAAPYTSDTPAVDALEWVAERLGSLGTNLLLLLSGFFIAQSVASGRFSYPRFVWLRVVRILFPYMVVVSLAIGFTHLFPQHAPPSAIPANLWTALLQLLPLPGLTAARPVLTVAWTLSYIIAGYLVLPVFGFALRSGKVQRGGRLAAWAVITAIVLACGLFTGILPIRFCYIPAGCLLFEWQVSGVWNSERPLMVRILTACSIAFLVIRLCVESELIGRQWGPHMRTGLFTGSGLLLISTVVGLALSLQQRYEQQLNRRALSVSLIAGYGRTGYSFYLLHGPVAKLFAAVVFPVFAAAAAPAVAFWLVMPLCWGVAAFGSLLMYRLVEKPCRHILMNRRSWRAVWPEGRRHAIPVHASSFNDGPALVIGPGPFAMQPELATYQPVGSVELSPR